MSEQSQGTNTAADQPSVTPAPGTEPVSVPAEAPEVPQTAPTPAPGDTIPDVPSPDPSTVPVPGEPDPVAPEPVEPAPEPEPVIPEPEPIVPEPEPVVPEPEPATEAVVGEPVVEAAVATETEPVTPEPTLDAEATPEAVEVEPTVEAEPTPTAEPTQEPESATEAPASEPVAETAASEAPEAETVTPEPAVEAEATPEPATDTTASEPVVEAAVASEPVSPEPEPEPVVEAEAATTEAEPVSEPAVEAVAATEPETTEAEPAVEAETTPADAAPATPRPAAPKPGPVPSPAALAGRKAAVTPVSPGVAAPVSTSDSIKFGRVGEDGTVFVKDGDDERAVGSYPEATHEEALAYFARKYDELAANALLLEQRLGQTDLTAHEARESLKTLRDQIGEANVVGDLPALRDRVTQIEAAVKERQRTETERRAQAKAEATDVRESLVAEAESLAAADAHQIQWKSASAKMRGMLDEWRSLQKKGPKLDKDVENALWHRLSSARSSFDKARKAFFSELDTQHAEAKRAKEKLVAEAEALSTNKDWGPTAGAFKRLMQDWRRAGRAQRADDDALWERFKAAQDHFFDAKDAVVAAENEEFRANLAVKEELLKEAETLVPVKDLESAKATLRTIQEKWDEAGKVPREDMSRIEGRLRKVEQAVRDLEDAKWTKSNPELNARAQSMVDQLERAVQGLEQDLEAAKAGGNERKIAEAQAALDARRQWLDSARGGLSEFGG